MKILKDPNFWMSCMILTIAFFIISFILIANQHDRDVKLWKETFYEYKGCDFKCDSIHYSDTYIQENRMIKEAWQRDRDSLVSYAEQLRYYKEEYERQRYLTDFIRNQMFNCCGPKK